MSGTSSRAATPSRTRCCTKASRLLWDQPISLTIINPNVDPAYSVDLLLLSVTEDDSFVDVPMLRSLPFPEDSGCGGINENGAVTPTILGEGVAAEGGETLYLGSAVLQPGAYD